MRPITVPPKKPPRTMALDGLSSFVPALRSAARSLRREEARAWRDFRPTDVRMLAADAKAIEALAAHLDVGRRP